MKRLDICKLIIRGTLKSVINNPKNNVLVFKCCGGLVSPIIVKGHCPHCTGKNTESITLWKFNLIESLVRLEMMNSF